MIQNYTDNTNGDVSLTVENVWYFLFPLRSRCAHVLLERKINLTWSIVFFLKKVFIKDSVLWKCDKSKYSLLQIMVVLKNNFQTNLKKSYWGLWHCRNKAELKQQTAVPSQNPHCFSW